MQDHSESQKLMHRKSMVCCVVSDPYQLFAPISARLSSSGKHLWQIDEYII